MAGQALVKFTGATEEECTVYKNKIARFLLGISDDTCSSYDDAKVPAIASVQYTGAFHGVNVLGEEKYSDSYVYCLASSLGSSDTLGVFSNGYWSRTSDWGQMLPVCSSYGGTVSSYWDNGGHIRTLTGRVCLMFSYTCLPGTETTLKKTQDGKISPTVSVDGSDGKTYSATGASHSEGGNVSTPSVLLPTGVTPTSVSLSKSTSDGSSSTVATSDDVSSNAKSAALDLIDVATGKSCYLEAQGCADWAAQATAKTAIVVTSAATQTTTTNSDMPFKCMSGSAEVAIGECTALKNAFTSLAASTGETASDPKTGEALDTPTQEVTDTSPSFANCVATEVSWNPVSWVTVPVKCALQWAFVPDEDVITTSETKIKQATNSTIITKFQDFFNRSVPAAAQDDSSCEGPEFHVEFAGFTLIKSSHPMSVCSGSGLEWAPFLSRTIIILFCLLAALFSAVKGIQIIVGIEHRRDVGNDKL